MNNVTSMWIKVRLAIEFNRKFDMRKVAQCCNYPFKKNLCEVTRLCFTSQLRESSSVLFFFFFTFRKTNTLENKIALGYRQPVLRPFHEKVHFPDLTWCDASFQKALFKYNYHWARAHAINTNKNNDGLIVLIAAISMCIILSAMWR